VSHVLESLGRILAADIEEDFLATAIRKSQLLLSPLNTIKEKITPQQCGGRGRGKLLGSLIVKGR
jgi:hypothetical protein